MLDNQTGNASSGCCLANKLISVKRPMHTNQHNGANHGAGAHTRYGLKHSYGHEHNATFVLPLMRASISGADLPKALLMWCMKDLTFI